MTAGARTTIDHDLHLVERPMPTRAAVILAAAVAAATPVVGQGVPSLMSRDVALEDFGLRSVEDVGRGRVSVVLLPEGPRLDVQYLLEAASGDPTPVPPRASPDGSLSASPSGATSAGRVEEPLAALWVWNTVEILADAAERADFLSFVGEQGIDRVFLQLVPAEGETSAAGFVPFDGAAMGRLVGELRVRGALTYALDGDPRYVLPQNRAGVLRTVARVAEHNRHAPAAERFVGVRYDVEPYVLPGFQSARRTEILTDYLELVEAVAAAAREGDLTLGLDIPFWLDVLDEVTGEPFEAVVDGTPTPVLGPLLDLADDVAVMAYRTVSGGPDGVIEHAAGELARGDGAGVGVFVGLETTELPDELRYRFGGQGRSGLPVLPDAAWLVVEERSSGSARVWLVNGADALSDLEQATRDAVSLRYWFAGSPVPLAADVLSFHSLGPDSMRRVAREVLDGFGRRPAFRGIAYHDYRGLKELLEGR